MSQMSPLQTVKKEFGTKEKLVEKLLTSLSKREGESKEDFKKRMMKVSSAKLRQLSARSAKTK